MIVEFDLGEETWRIAGRAFQAYAARRRKHRDPGPRRIMADFLIGAPSHYELNNIAVVNYNQFMHFLYLQDDWKVTQRLTLDL